MDNKLQQLNLAEKDFKMLIDGLDALPEKDLASDMMKDLMVGLLANEGAEMKERMQKMEDDRKKDDYIKQMLIEDIRILQGKLLMLKRYLQENNALTETSNIINYFK